MKYYGKLYLLGKDWVLANVSPHVSIKLKSIFEKIPKSSVPPYKLINNTQTCNDLEWFTSRYPFEISTTDLRILKKNKSLYDKAQHENESILSADYIPSPSRLNEGEEARNYQLTGADFAHKVQRVMIGDEIGLGKTLTAILLLLKPGTVPALVVVQTHLTNQWQDEIKRFTNLSTHIIKGTRPYKLPASDVYIIKYSCLSGWVNIFSGLTKTIILDEVQEIRRCESDKHTAAKNISRTSDYVVGLSATPIYNYGEEIFNIMTAIKEGSMDTRDNFLREWTGGSKIVKHPEALGSYLRDNFLFLRRTRKDVGRELPIINKIVYTVGYDEHAVKDVEDISRILAMKVVSGDFMERGQAARELDVMMRLITGVSKAKEVAAYVKMLLDSGEPVVLVGWHRDVYKIWLEELAEYKPAMYTGSEGGTQKLESKRRFISGETKLFILSLRSGIGLDGLQYACKYVVFGEFDWSPKVHDQVIGRVDRDGQENQVTAIYLKSDYGSDPLIIDLLGIKAAQSHAIVDPMLAVQDNYSDESRIKQLAEIILKNNKQYERISN